MNSFMKYIVILPFCFPKVSIAQAPTPLENFRAGSGFNAGNTLYAPLKAVVLALVVVWLIWLVVAAYRSWSASNSDSVSFVSVVLRVALMFIVTGVILDMTYS